MDSIYAHPDYEEYRKRILNLNKFIFITGVIIGVVICLVMIYVLSENVITYNDSDLSIDDNITVNGLILKVIENTPCKNVEYDKLAISLSSC